jgi:primosomal protein N' (replication factor Y)
MLFVDVIVPIPLAFTYTYAVPEQWHQNIKTLQRVLVHFGKNKHYAALVVKVHDTAPTGYNAKFIEGIIDDEPMFISKQVQLWYWMSQYYMCSLGDVYNAATPGALKVNTDSIIQAKNISEEVLFALPEKQRLVLEYIRDKQICTLSELVKLGSLPSVYKHIKKWLEKDFVEIEDTWSQGYKPKTAKHLFLHPHFLVEDELNEVLNELQRAPKQLAIVLAYLRHADYPDCIPVLQKRVLDDADASTASLKPLIEKGVLFQSDEIVDRLVPSAIKQKAMPELSGAQQDSHDAIFKAYPKHPVCLLHGVTGSGKTEIYVKLIQTVLEKGQNALFLVPEIALSTQLIKRLYAFFGTKLLCYHSKVNANERVEVWSRVREGNEPFVLIGVRSSVFLPFKKLGLIIVDEEHESSYKQQEPAPRYQARDTAVVMGSLHKCQVVLASATPSVESIYNVRKDKYALVELSERFGNAVLPEIKTINLNKEGSIRKGEGFISEVFHDAIAERLERNEQSIVFQNRRGYVPQVLCETCGHIPFCVNCDVPLTYHRYINQLKCHYCGHHESVFTSCPACNSSSVTFKGLGTERIQEDLKLLFPENRVDRLDFETASGKKSLDDILTAFESGKGDILVGTQMLSKGLDFAKVSFVGVVSMEHLLAFPDFRATERTYQLITQVAGRAGRSEAKGEVFLQTYNPELLIIQQIINQDFEGFLSNELAERETFKYPPYYRLIRFSLKHKDKMVVWEAAKNLAVELKPIFGNLLFGPEAPYVERVRGRFLVDVMCKFGRNADQALVKEKIREALETFRINPNNKKPYLVIDVDPY